MTMGRHHYTTMIVDASMRPGQEAPDDNASLEKMFHESFALQ